MTQPDKALYEFGPYRLVPAEQLLLRGSEPVPLTPKAFEMLVALVRRAGRLVEKNELLSEVWPETSVEESNVAQNVFALRRALTRTEDDPEYIETVPKRGYRFAAPVTIVQDGGRQLEPIRKDQPQAVVPATTHPAPRHRFALVLMLITAALLLGAAVVWTRIAATGSAQAGKPITLSRLRTGERIPSAAISPDGRYLAHVIEEGNESTIVVRQISTVTDLPVLQPARDVYYWGLAYSPDGDSLYYVEVTPRDPFNTLYRVSVLGGAPRKIATAVDSVVGLSPDGRQIAFVRDTTGPESLLIVANSDGTAERVLARRTKRDSFFSSSPRGGPSWSPDGSTIATGIISFDGGYHGQVITVDVHDGTQKPLTTQHWYQVARCAWLPDGTGLLITARDSSVSQIWYVTYPDGEARRVTTDLTDYHDLALTSDGRALVSVQYERRSTLGFVPEKTASAARRATSGMDEGFYGLSWTPQGELVYASDAGGNLDLWLLAADGTTARQLTTAPDRETTPDVSPDGRSIAFLSSRGDGNPHIWRMNIDGTGQRQLTHGGAQGTPMFTPDGRWVVYAETRGGIWKVPAEGGTPVQVARGNVHTPSVSPDGSLLVCAWVDPRREQMALYSLTNSEKPVRLIDYPDGHTGATVRWTADSRSLVYVRTHDKVGNLWTFPLDGSEPQQLTHFTSERLFNFAISRDHQQLAVARSPIAEHVVLLRDFR